MMCRGAATGALAGPGALCSSWGLFVFSQDIGQAPEECADGGACDEGRGHGDLGGL